MDFDPATGAVKSRGTHQGHDDESTWSRGQAWAVYGFTVAYRESGDARFLETARATAEYLVAHLPADAVPYWDFELPSTAGEPRDSSAAAVAAAGLLELARLEPDAVRARRWLGAARAILSSLTSPAYLAEGTGEDSILLHGTQNRSSNRYDTGLIYGDYYFLQALLRYLRWFGPRRSSRRSRWRPRPARRSRSTSRRRMRCEPRLLHRRIPAPRRPRPARARALPERSSEPRRRARVVYFPAPDFAGTDSFSYRASDGAHASETAAVTIAVLGAKRTTFLAVADAKVSSGSPGKNYGSEADLRVRAPSPEWRAPTCASKSAALTGPVTDARLRLFANDGSDMAGRVFAVASSWSEGALTWNDAPALQGDALDAGGPVAAGTWAEFDVTPSVTSNGTCSFALASSRTDSAYFSAREGAHPPELVVTAGVHRPRARSRERSPAPP